MSSYFKHNLLLKSTPTPNQNKLPPYSVVVHSVINYYATTSSIFTKASVTLIFNLAENCHNKADNYFNSYSISP